MKKIILSILICLSAFVIWAQRADLPATISWGQELKEPNSTYLDKVVSANSSGMITIRHKNSMLENIPKIYLEQYDEKMSLKRSEKIALGYDGKKLKFEDVLNLNGQLYLLTSYNNKAKEKTYLFYQKLSKRFTPSKKLNKIAEINTNSWLREGSYDIELSKDSSKVLVYGQLPYKKNSAEKFTLNIFDNTFNSIWKKKITLPYSDELLSIQEYQVDNDGNVYILGRLYHNKVRNRKNGKPNYHYIILAYRPDSEQAAEYKIELREKFITDLTFKIGNDNNLVCAGFYSEKLSYTIKGTCFLGINAETKETFNIHLKEFDFDFLTEFMSENAKERAKRAERSGNTRRTPELYKYSLDDLILRSDGGAVLIAEQYYIEERKYYDRYGTYNSIYYYNYNDIIVVNIRPDGEIEWATHIPKRQLTRNDGGYYSSYSMATVRDRLYFVFNDNIRNFSDNENRWGRKRIYNFDGRNSVIALAEIKIDGSLTTWPLFSNRDAGIITRPKICLQTASRKMVIYGERGKRYRFANLYFQK